MTLDATITTGRPEPGAAVVTITGHLDTYSATDVRTTLLDAINQGRYRQVVDLTGVTFVDSTGLAVLVGAVKRARAHGGDLVLAVDLDAPTGTGKALRITGVHKSIGHAPTLGEALALLTPKPPPVADQPAPRPAFWPPQVGDVWLGNIRETPTTPFAFVCAKPGVLMGTHDWGAEDADRTFGPLRLVWRAGQVVTAPHSSEMNDPDPDRYWTIWTADRREVIAQVSGPDLVDADAALRQATTKPHDYEQTKANSYVEETDETGFNLLLDWDALSEGEKADLRPATA